MTNKDVLNKLNECAEKQSTCIKAQVGACIITNSNYQHLKYLTEDWLPDICVGTGVNTSMPDNCKEVGCHRIKIYGEDSCKHRLPSDCYALHAEINAICKAARRPFDSGLIGTTLYVTRYPCEACARAIVAAGITRVIYSGAESISEQTSEILKEVEVIKVE